MQIVIVGNITPPTAPHAIVSEVAGVTPPAVAAIGASGQVLKTWGPGYDDAEVTAWANRTKTRLTKLEFMERFDGALAGIMAAAKVSPDVEVWLEMFRATTPEPDGTSIDITDPRTVAGIQALVTAGLLTQPQADVVLA